MRVPSQFTRGNEKTALGGLNESGRGEKNVNKIIFFEILNREINPKY
jgi:hypothetical protein